MSAALQTLAVILLPIAIPFAKKQWLYLQQYKHTRPRPFTAAEYRRLACIIVLSTFYAILVLRESFRVEENVYRVTNSRLAISIDVLRHRAPDSRLPDSFWTMLEAPEMKLAYLRLGPEPLLNCVWCSMNQINSYLYYSLASIALAYLGHLILLSICSPHRNLAAIVMTTAFGLEAYARAGGLDKFNARTKTAGDIIFIASFAPVVRLCFFLWTLAAASLKIWFDAQFPTDQPTLQQVRGDLIATIESLRASNAMRRAVGDNEVLRDHAVQFWARNEVATKRLDEMQDLQHARTEAGGRFADIRQESSQAREFIDRVADRTAFMQ